MNEIKLRYNKAAMDFNAVTKETVSKMIEDTTKAFKTAKAKAQYTAVSVMVLAVMHPDDAVALANELCLSLGDGIKGEGMVKFLNDKGGFRLGAEKKDGFVSVKNEEWIRANLQSAKDTPWWTYAPASPFKGFDLVEEITKVLKRADAMAKKEGEDAELVHVDVAMLRTMRALIGGGKVHGDDALKLVEKLLPAEEVAEAA